MHLYLAKKLKRYSVSHLEVNDAEFVHQQKQEESLPESTTAVVIGRGQQKLWSHQWHVKCSPLYKMTGPRYVFEKCLMIIESIS